MTCLELLGNGLLGSIALSDIFLDLRLTFDHDRPNDKQDLFIRVKIKGHHKIKLSNPQVRESEFLHQSIR